MLHQALPGMPERALLQAAVPKSRWLFRVAAGGLGLYWNRMLTFPQIDPVAVTIGPLTVHWYGLMYLAGFLAGGALGAYRARRPGSTWTVQQVWDLVFYVALGVILGGRLGYVVFYKAGYYLVHPVELLYIWSGGMSFHGGLLGVVVAVALFARRHGKPGLAVADFLAPLCAPGLFAGRIGNFINQELWGRVSDVPWAMVFPAAGPQPPAPLATVRGHPRGPGVVHPGLGLFGAATHLRAGHGPVPGGLRWIPLCCGVFPRTGRAPGSGGARLAYHGSVAQFAGGPGGTLAVAESPGRVRQTLTLI